MTKTLAFVTVLVLAGAPTPLSAQPKPVDEQNASETRERVRQILDQYPPSLRQVLRCDPSLLNRPEYMAPYPTPAGYVAQHPEIGHNPGFFIGGACGGGGNLESRSQMAISLENIFVGLEVMLGVMFGVGTVG